MQRVMLQEVNSVPLLALILSWITFLIVFVVWYKIIQSRSCGIFLFPLSENLRGDYYYIIGFHSNQFFKSVPKCNITIVLLSSTAKHQVIIRKDNGKHSLPRRLGTTLILSSSALNLGNIESMSVIFHGEPNNWRLEWLKVMDLQLEQTWEFIIPGGVLLGETAISYNLNKKYSNEGLPWLRTHNWASILRPHYINSRVGLFTYISFIFATLLTSFAITTVVSLIFLSQSLYFWISSIGLSIVGFTINTTLDVILHLSQIPNFPSECAKTLVWLFDEWISDANDNVQRASKHLLRESRLLQVACSESSKSEESSVTSNGIQIVRQIPIEDFATLQSKTSDQLEWPTIVRLHHQRKTDADAPSASASARKSLVFQGRETDADETIKTSSVARFKKLQDSRNAVRRPPMVSSAAASSTVHQASAKRSRINVQRLLINTVEVSETEEESTTTIESEPSMGYVITFVSQRSMVSIREPIIQLTKQEDAAFVRLNIPFSESDWPISPDLQYTSSETLIQDSMGILWIPKTITNLEKKQYFIRFFRRWKVIRTFLQGLDRKLNSLHSYSMQHLKISREAIVIERVRLEVSRLLIIFQVPRIGDSVNHSIRPSRKVKSTPVQGVTKFTPRYNHSIMDEYFHNMALVLQNFTIQITMIVIYCMKDFVTVIRDKILNLSGTVLFDLQTVVTHFTEQIDNLHDYRQLNVRGRGSVAGDRRSDNRSTYLPTVSSQPNAAAEVQSGDSSTSVDRRLSSGVQLSQKRTQSLQSSLESEREPGTHYSVRNVPALGSRQSPPYQMLSADELTGVSKFVDCITATVKEILEKEMAGSSLYDFIICRNVDATRSFRYSCYEFLHNLIGNLGNCVVHNVTAVLGKELHPHVKNLVFNELRRVTAYVTDQLPDTSNEIRKWATETSPMRLFPIDITKNGAIELLLCECVNRCCFPPRSVRNKEELHHYKNDLWLQTLLDDFIKPEWLVRSKATILQLASKAVPVLHNKLIVGSKIMEATMSKIDEVHNDPAYQIRDSAPQDGKLNFENTDFLPAMNSIYKRLGSIHFEAQTALHELSKIYEQRRLTVAEKDYMHHLVNTGLIRNLIPERVAGSNVDNVEQPATLARIAFTPLQLIQIRDRFLDLPQPPFSSKWSYCVRIAVLVEMCICSILIIVLGFSSSATFTSILVIAGGTVLVDASLLQTIKSFVLSRHFSKCKRKPVET